jgi:hypothetical protein
MRGPPHAEKLVLQMNLQKEIDMESLILRGQIARPAYGDFSIPCSPEEMRALWQSRLDRGEIGVANPRYTFNRSPGPDGICGFGWSGRCTGHWG